MDCSTKHWRVPVVTIMTLLLAVPVSAASLQVTQAAARQGNFGLEVIYDDTTQAYLVDDSPSGETRYVATFFLNINDLDMLPCEAHQIFRARRQQPSGFTPFRIQINRTCVETPDGEFNYLFTPFVRDDSGAWHVVGFTHARPFKNHLFTIDWQASSGPGADDGFIRILKGGNVVMEMVGLDTDEQAVDQVHLGAVAALDAGTSGTMYLDEFVSTRVPQF